jgi:thiol-disulfide isomerase/thioredoxin
MKQFILTGFMLVFCLSIYASAPVGALKVGDRVPDAFWGISFKYFKGGKVFTRDLSGYRGKLLVIDFWATSCVPCLKDMSGQLGVLRLMGQNVGLGLVRTTYAKEEQIRKFYASGRNPIGERFESIILDTVLSKMFPHSLIPHLVWIGADGVVRSFTDGEAFNVDKVGLALRGIFGVGQKADMALNVPMYMEKIPANMVSVNMLFQGHVDGLGSGNEYRTVGDKTGYLIKNLPLRWLYTSVAMKKFPWFGAHRMVLKFDGDALFNGYGFEPESHWTMDFWLPSRDSAFLFSRMFDYLNENSGYGAVAERLATKCLVLTYSPKADRLGLLSRGGVMVNRLFRADGKLVNAPVGYLVNRMMDQGFIALPVIDETGAVGNIDVVVPKCASLEELKSALYAYGLVLSEAVRDLDMLVISRNNSQY